MNCLINILSLHWTVVLSTQPLVLSKQFVYSLNPSQSSPAWGSNSNIIAMHHLDKSTIANFLLLITHGIILRRFPHNQQVVVHELFTFVNTATSWGQRPGSLPLKTGPRIQTIENRHIYMCCGDWPRLGLRKLDGKHLFCWEKILSKPV